MAANTPPEIILELSGGQLTIRTAEAIYRVVVAAPAQTLQERTALPTAPPAKALAEAPPPPPADDDWGVFDLDEPSQATQPIDGGKVQPTFDPRLEQGPGAAYYRDLSHDMYREIGALARRLSMSIRDVRHVNVDNVDLTSTGRQLEMAKDELQDVVKMTEQATMRIMDLGEDIQQAVGHTKSIMERLAPVAVDCATPGDDAERSQARQRLAEALQGLGAFIGSLAENPLDQLARQANELIEQAQAAPPAQQPAAPPPAPSGPYYQFPLDLVFQTVYELCTNEAVKKHIKGMWDAAAEFSQEQIEAEMNKLAPAQPDGDNFLNLDLKAVLRVLFQATANERFQGVLKKMAQTSDQIFLEQTLPLEAMPGQAPAPAAAPEAPPAPAAGPTPQVLAGLENLAQALQTAAEGLNPPPLPDDLEQLLEQALDEQPDSCNIVDPDLLRQLHAAEEHISVSVNSIIESLSFQDLSGQIIYRIVRLLSDFQVQLLAMVVSFGSKLKARETNERITVDQSEKLAQEEVDRVLSTIKTPAAEKGDDQDPGDGSKLDQDAINDMLASMGF